MGNNSREQFGSRLGYILVSAGCAIGIGNVWKFPYICGQYGGAIFMLIYLVFLVILGIPVMTAEFAIGRASRRSAALAYDVLEPKHTKWHWLRWLSVVGCYLLMMYYTTVAGWMMNYGFKEIDGAFVGKTPEEVTGGFGAMLGDPIQMTFWTVLVCLLGFLVCFFGIRKGVERVTKYLMILLLILMVILAVHSVSLEGANEGVRYYLVPSLENIEDHGIGEVVFNAMSHAFFTLSIGIGSMLIFGSYIGKERSLLGESMVITALDTFVALTAGFIIIPSCFAYGVEVGAGPSLIFITIPNLFTQMAGGRWWGTIFFIFLTFAAMSTVVAVFENIIAFFMDRFDWDRKKSTLISGVLVTVLSLPCVFGYNIWSRIQMLGEGSTVLDFEDFIVSNNLLPLGSLAFILFCTHKNGWGFENFLAEVNAGKGLKLPDNVFMKFYLTWLLPLVIIAVYLKGYWDMFKPEVGYDARFFGWMAFALLFLAAIITISLLGGKKRREQ
ncbi:MAG: sodium-dependent transporter [Clostridia bacterium]|nr:sodium-dependent transporter [Clostridia bacterium]